MLATGDTVKNLCCEVKIALLHSATTHQRRNTSPKRHKAPLIWSSWARSQTCTIAEPASQLLDVQWDTQSFQLLSVPATTATQETIPAAKFQSYPQ